MRIISCLLAVCGLLLLAAGPVGAQAKPGDLLIANEKGTLGASVLALTPLATLAFMSLMAVLWPGLVAPEAISATSLIGAVIVVAGSLLTSLGGDS